MRILITGGDGFIGQRLLSHLPTADIVDLKRGTDVRSLTSLPYDIVFHLAATARVGVSLREPKAVLDNNISSLVHLLDLCKGTTTRLLVASSSSVKHAELSRNPYAMSKHIGEQLSNMYRTIWNVNVSNVRFFNVYGPGEITDGEFTTLIKSCKNGYLSGGFFIEGDGSIVRDFTHVDDVCEGLIKSVEMVHMPLIELGSGEASTSVRDIVEEFQHGTNLPCEMREGRMGDPTYTNASVELFPEGWKQKRNVIEYIREWKRNGCLPHE